MIEESWLQMKHAMMQMVPFQGVELLGAISDTCEGLSSNGDGVISTLVFMAAGGVMRRCGRRVGERRTVMLKRVGRVVCWH